MSSNAKPPITRNLRRLKDERSVTVREIAVAVEVGERLVQAWLSEEGTDPSWPNIVALADYFRVPPEFFFTENPTIPEVAA